MNNACPVCGASLLGASVDPVPVSDTEDGERRYGTLAVCSQECRDAYDAGSDTVEVPRDTLAVLRDLVDGVLTEYGTLDHIEAVIDAGVVLDYDDPTPRSDREHLGFDAYRSMSSVDDTDVDRVAGKYDRHASGGGGE